MYPRRAFLSALLLLMFVVFCVLLAFDSLMISSSLLSSSELESCASVVGFGPWILKSFAISSNRFIWCFCMHAFVRCLTCSIVSVMSLPARVRIKQKKHSSFCSRFNPSCLNSSAGIAMFTNISSFCKIGIDTSVALHLLQSWDWYLWYGLRHLWHIVCSFCFPASQ